MVTSSTNLLERRNLGFWLSYPLKWISISKDQKTKSANGPSFMRHPDCNWDGEFPVWRNPWQSIYIYRIYIICIHIYIDVCVYVEGRGFNSPIAILLLRGVATCVGLPKQQPLRPSICAENLRKHRLYWKQLGCPGSLQCPNQSWGHEFC